MAVKGTLARLLVDRWDFSCETSGIDVTMAMTEEDVSSLCDTAANYAPTLAACSIEHNGYMKDPLGIAGSIEQEMNARMGVMGSYVAALFGIDDPACPAYILDNTFGSSMQIQAPATGILTLNGAWGQGQGGHRGIRIYDDIANAVGNQTAVDMGVAGTNGGEFYVFFQNAPGLLGGTTFVLQHATTVGGTYSTIATIIAPTLGAFKATFSGAVNRFLRLGITNMGSATALEIVAVACVRGLTE